MRPLALGGLLAALLLMGAGAPAVSQASSAPPPQSAPAPTPSPARGAESEFRSLMFRGMRSMDGGDYATAVDLFDQAVKIAPRSVQALFHLGRALVGQKRVKQGQERFTAVLKIQPGHTGAILGIAAIDEGTGDYPSAEKRYREALALVPDPRTQRQLASLLGRSGRSAEAESLLNQLLTADPEDADIRFELAIARMLHGNCQAAIPDFRRVIESQPRRVTALFHLGNCLSRTGAAQEAREVLERFRKTQEEEKRREDIDKKVHFGLLEVDGLAAAGKMDEAVKKAGELVVLAPENATAHGFLGSLLAEIGRSDEALVELKRAAELDPTDVASLTESGRLLAQSGRMDEALEYFKKAASADPNAAEPHRFLTILYQQMGRREDAERERAIFLRLSGGS